MNNSMTSLTKKIAIYIFSFCIGLALVWGFASCKRGAAPAPQRFDDRDRGDDRRDPEPRPTRAGGGECEGDEDCEEQCDELFGSGSDEKECLELTQNEVEAMFEAFNDDDGILADPDDDDLKDVYPEDIENLFEIDDNVWNKLIRKYSNSEAKDVLLWIAEDTDIFSAISSLDDDDDEDFLRDLLKESGSGDISNTLTQKIGDEYEDNFIYIAQREGNDDAVELAHEILLNDCISDVHEGVSSSNLIYTAARIPDEDYRDAACTLGEVYCKKRGSDYIFEDVFDELVENADGLQDYIESERTRDKPKQGLGLEDDSDELEKVCREFCDRTSTGRTGSGSWTSTVKPTVCPS